MPSTKALTDSSDGSEGGTEGDEPNLVERIRGGRRRKKRSKPDEGENKTPATALSTASVETNIDDLWNEFKRDCESVEPKATKSSTSDDTEPATSARCVPASSSSSKTKTVTQLFEFAGEAVEVRKEVPIDAPTPPAPPVLGKRPAAGPKGGLSSILGQIGKKNKLSVLEKSKLDWNNFKETEGIREDLEKHNRGKDGYLEKQDFLQRTDLRQFEKEKALRSSSRLK